MITSRILTASELLDAPARTKIAVEFAGQDIVAVVSDAVQVTANLIVVDLVDIEGNDIPWSLALNPADGVEVLYV